MTTRQRITLLRQMKAFLAEHGETKVSAEEVVQYMDQASRTAKKKAA